MKPSQGETHQPQPQPQPTLPSPLPLPATEEEDTDDIETTDEEDDEDEPFFDIELTVPDEDEEEEKEKEKANESDSEFRFTLSPSTNDPNLLQLELDSSEPNSKSKPQLTASLLKSATKFRVFISGLNKSSDSTAKNPNQQPKSDSESQKKKLFTVKFKVDEVPFVSYFTRDNSSKGKGKRGNNEASQKQKKQHNTDESKLHSPSSDEKQRFSKEAIEKYLKKVKPLYIKVSRKYAEKLKFSGQLNTSSVKVRARADATENEGKNVKSQKQGTLPLPAGLRVVCKRLGKSRSASSSTPSPEAGTVSSRRRDDSMTQQQDGIQSAILHCKSSFNSSKEVSSQLELDDTEGV